MAKTRIVLQTSFLAVSVLLSLASITPSAVAVHYYQACIEFSQNGVPIPGAVWCDAQQISNVNDILIIFTQSSRTTVQFTLNGNPLGRPFRAPGAANNFDIDYDIVRGVITRAVWTRNDSPIGNPLPVPAGANDFLLITTTGVITNVWWTFNGQLVYATGVPPGTNDLRFVLVPFVH